ncbi:glycosyltransferase family 4 protein [Massilia glaciei]|uniref:Glycosyltransferase n=1 Tax=Massilia glaciei TaxID=1524097 RepID=A0A2U2HJC6_9BURK|nr:glycosyltransferase family 4 protein [Massilia glaciei]PWF47651.1 glycosyltransferase [Massilia glaciei]
MRIGILSYPMLFQREGGLQIQVRETIAALNRIEGHGRRKVSVELLDPCRSRLGDFDLVHVFAATNGNHRIVEAAAELGVPVVLSPLISPGWNRASGGCARVAERLIGRLTSWNVQTSYAQMRRALQMANLVVALGEAERRAINAAFLIEDSKIRVFPNGISPHFFKSGADHFRRHTGIGGDFVLMAGAISPYKNQLAMAHALADLKLPFVLIGQAQECDRDYLRRVRNVCGVTWLGPLRHDDALLASAYAAASVFVLPSQGEVFPLSVLEALASGTPVVMTAESALELPDSEFALKKVRWDDTAAQKRAVLGLVGAPPPRELVRALVRRFTWERVAGQIAGCYADVLSAPARRDGGERLAV